MFVTPSTRQLTNHPAAYAAGSPAILPVYQPPGSLRCRFAKQLPRFGAQPDQKRRFLIAHVFDRG
jgi:hypothetical protein